MSYCHFFTQCMRSPSIWMRELLSVAVLAQAAAATCGTGCVHQRPGGGATSISGRDADAGEDAVRSGGAGLFFAREAKRGACTHASIDDEIR